MANVTFAEIPRTAVFASIIANSTINVAAINENYNMLINPMQLLAEICSEKEAAQKRSEKTIALLVKIAPIALRAVRISADNGNVRCIAAMSEIEAILRNP